MKLRSKIYTNYAASFQHQQSPAVSRFIRYKKKIQFLKGIQLGPLEVYVRFSSETVRAWASINKQLFEGCLKENQRVCQVFVNILKERWTLSVLVQRYFSIYFRPRLTKPADLRYVCSLAILSLFVTSTITTDINETQQY